MVTQALNSTRKQREVSGVGLTFLTEDLLYAFMEAACPGKNSLSLAPL